MMTDRGGRRRGVAVSWPVGPVGPAGPPGVRPDRRRVPWRRRAMRRLMALVAVFVVGGVLLDRACGGPPPGRGSFGDQPSAPARPPHPPHPDAGHGPAHGPGPGAPRGAP